MDDVMNPFCGLKSTHLRVLLYWIDDTDMLLTLRGTVITILYRVILREILWSSSGRSFLFWEGGFPHGFHRGIILPATTLRPAFYVEDCSRSYYYHYYLN